jgi:hypothetical protein
MDCMESLLNGYGNTLDVDFFSKEVGLTSLNTHIIMS